MNLLYFLSCLTILQGIVALIDGIRAAAYMKASFRRRLYAGAATAGRFLRSRTSFGRVGVKPTPTRLAIHVAVLCPCKGTDPELKENIRSILAQDHPRFTAYFIVESEADPAYGLLQGIGARVLVAGPANECGQKVHNLRFGVRHADPTADTFVFCDADARFPRQWLRQLTSPLDDDRVAVSSGYRWYVAPRFNLPTLLRSAWNASVVSMLGDHNRNFAWGGSMALRRETFDRIGVLDAWRGAVSDDYAVTRAARRAGGKIVFVPTCLIPSHGVCTFAELLEFTTRQIIITRVYNPRLWRIAFLSQTMFNITFLWLTAAVVSHRPLLLEAALLWTAIYTLASVKSAVRLSAVRSVIHDPSLFRYGWFYILSSPIVALLYQYNMVRSALTTDIEWRQIHYTLISPNETRVRRSSVSAS